MDPLGAVTPYRQSALILDPELSSVLQEPGITLRRDGHQIARRAAQGVANKGEWTNVKFWPSGCWGLAPVQQDMANLYESSLAASLVITDWSFVQTAAHGGGTQDIMQTAHNWAKSTAAGASYSGLVPDTGDVFYRKRIPAGSSNDPGALGVNAGFDSARPALPYPNTDIPMDRIGYTNSVLPHDAGIFLRWRTPGNHLSPHRYIAAVHFGQYALVLTGSGEAQLWEYAKRSDTTRYYVQRDSWRYTQEAHASAGTAHCMAIFPVVASDGNRYINFSNLATAAAPNANVGRKIDTGQSVTGEHVYRVTTAVTGTDIDLSPGHVTTADRVRIDVRRDTKPDIQISRLGFLAETNGILLDDAILVPNGNFTGNTATINQNYGFVTPSGTTCAGEILDAVTGTTFVTGTDKYPRAKFTLTTSDPLVTPTLWGYHHVQAPVHVTYAPGSFVIAGNKFHITGYAGDPQTELATVEAYDVSGQHTRLQKRGRFSAIVTTTFAPDPAAPGTIFTVILFHGVAISPQGEQVGAQLAHPGGSGPGDAGLPTGTYVAPSFWRYSINICGMYHRLNETSQPPYPAIYANDLADPQNGDGYDQTWKVTDVIVDVLGRCGFDAAQRNIPDLPYRIWPGYTNDTSDLSIEPTTGLAEWLVRMIRDHLGAYLMFEPNSGAFGQWILIFGTQPLDDGTFANPVLNFSGEPAAVSGLANPSTPLSYAAVSGVKTVPYKSITGSQNPPDYNKITVSTGVATADSDTEQVVQQVIVNPLSYAVPGASISPDPDHPDYIGHCIPDLQICPELYVGGDGNFDLEATKATVNWVARRKYDYFCHGQILRFVDIPLTFVHDTSLSATVASSSGNWRPLRFQDPVMLDGDPSWLVKGIQPYWESDRDQRCIVEIIQPFPGQMFVGHDGVEKHKKSHRAQVTKHSGMPHSASHTGRTVPAHKHAQHHKLSIAGPIDTIQNPDGSFVTFTGWLTKTQTDG